MANEYGELEQMVNDVTSLDTARMTLRWALERLNSIEKERADLKKSLTLAEETSRRLQLKEAALKDAYESRTKTLDEKEDFYTKLEATMALLGEGKLDVQQLLKKEAKLDGLRKSLEDEYQEKFADLDRNQRSIIDRWNTRLLEVESQYAGKLSESQKKYDSLRAELEADYQGRLTSLQASYKAKEKDLTERIGQLEANVYQSESKVEARRRELETEYLNKKRETEENYRKLRGMLETSLEEKLRAADSDHAAQVRSLEASWQAERARLGEEQRVREGQFLAAQDKIKQVENDLAAMQEKHHAEMLKFLSEREAAFRARLEDLEKEKTAKEQGVRELSALMEKRAQGWAEEKAALEAETGRRIAAAEQAANERVLGMDAEYAARKQELQDLLEQKRAELQNEFDARLVSERRALEDEKARLDEERRLRDEGLARAAAQVKRLEAELGSAREGHNQELLERINSGEEAFRGKLAAFEEEKRAYNDTINKLTDDLRKAEYAVQAEKEKIAREFEARAAAYEARLARNEELFEQRRRSYEEALQGMASRLEAAAKAAAEEKEIFSKELTLTAARASAEADERVAAARADYEARKAQIEKDFEARYGDRLRALEDEKRRFGEALAERAAQLETAHARNAELEAAVGSQRAAADAKADELKRAHEQAFGQARAAHAEEIERASAAHEARLTEAVESRERLAREYSAELARVLEEGRKEAAAREERVAAELAAAKADYESRLAEAGGQADARAAELYNRLLEKEAQLARAADERAAAEQALKNAFEAERRGWSEERAKLVFDANARYVKAADERVAAEQALRAGFDAERRAWGEEKDRIVSGLEARLAGRVAEVSAAYEARLAALEKVREDLELELEQQRADALAEREFHAGFDAEKSAWASERGRFEASLKGLAERFAAAQAEISDLTNEKSRLARQVLDSESRLNATLVEAQAEAGREAEKRLQAAVEERTAELERSLEYSEAARNDLEHKAEAEINLARQKAAAARKELADAVKHASEMEAALALRHVEHQAAIAALHNKSAGEFETRLRAAVEAETLALKNELDAALAECDAVREGANEGAARLEQAALAAEERGRAAEGKAAAAEAALIRQKEEFTRELAARAGGQEEELRGFMRTMDEKFEAAGAAFAARIDEEKARAAARISALERAAEERERIMDEERRLVGEKLAELAQNEATLARRETALRDEALKAEAAAEAKRQELEREYNRRYAEVDRLRTELSRTIAGLKKPGRAE